MVIIRYNKLLVNLPRFRHSKDNPTENQERELETESMDGGSIQGFFLKIHTRNY